MCGIAGWGNLVSRPPDRGRLDRMCQALYPRGPDDGGAYFSSHGQVAWIADVNSYVRRAHPA